MRTGHRWTQMDAERKGPQMHADGTDADTV
jgi:hypothetical protein